MKNEMLMTVMIMVLFACEELPCNSGELTRGIVDPNGIVVVNAPADVPAPGQGRIARRWSREDAARIYLASFAETWNGGHEITPVQTERLKRHVDFLLDPRRTETNRTDEIGVFLVDVMRPVSSNDAWRAAKLDAQKSIVDFLPANENGDIRIGGFHARKDARPRVPASPRMQYSDSPAAAEAPSRGLMPEREQDGPRRH